jgi:hypothetical protein
MISRDERREAESQITRLIHSYFYRLDERDLEVVAAFFEDAAWHISPERVTHGKAEKLAWLRENTPAHDAYLGPQHLIGNSSSTLPKTAKRPPACPISSCPT